MPTEPQFYLLEFMFPKRGQTNVWVLWVINYTLFSSKVRSTLTRPWSCLHLQAPAALQRLVNNYSFQHQNSSLWPRLLLSGNIVIFRGLPVHWISHIIRLVAAFYFTYCKRRIFSIVRLHSMYQHLQRAVWWLSWWHSMDTIVYSWSQ